MGDEMKTKRTNTNIGSVSTCTMRPEDLIPCFLWELSHQTDRTREHYNLCRAIESRMKANDYYESEDVSDDLESLFDALDTYAPAYFYFGSHPGDGADYGYWLSENFTDDFDGLKVDDLSDVPARYTGDVLVINDHGNMTLYAFGRNGHKELWSLV
jgi:hypothetical protein